MKDLLEFILKGITGKDNFVIEEEVNEDAYSFRIILEPDSIGLIIGKGGKTIKAVQTLLRVRGKLENKKVFVNVSSKEDSSSSP